MGEFYETTVRVRYAETDQLGIVYHSNFLIWFEVGRVEAIRQMGLAYKQMELEDDCHILVAEAQCRYHHPARYDDVLRIRTRITEVRSRTIHFGYQVLHQESGKLLATGETKHVVCGRNGRPRTLPQKYRRAFAPWPARARDHSRT
jgi:acyl-CoA thioester hydrolase